MLSAASTRATMAGSDESEVISQPAPTSCIQVPTLRRSWRSTRHEQRWRNSTQRVARQKARAQFVTARWINATTAAPSPMAPPTRFTEPERTSPTANTPGAFDASGAGDTAEARDRTGADR